MAKRLSGSALAKRIQSGITDRLQSMDMDRHGVPTLAVIQVGNDPASTLYVSKKRAQCQAIGFHSHAIDLADDISPASLVQTIQSLNAHANIHGIMVQLPLPRHLSAFKILSHIDPKKDVDGLHPLTLGQLAMHHPTFLPCTPLGILWLMRHHRIGMKGQKVCIVGCSNIVGKPIAMMLLNLGATITLCHIDTTQAQLKHAVSSADILIIAIGKRGVIDPTWVQHHCTLIDVGIHRIDGEIHGDCDAHALEHIEAFTPVPGGVGPMTIAALMAQTLNAYALQTQQPWDTDWIDAVIATPNDL